MHPGPVRLVSIHVHLSKEKCIYLFLCGSGCLYVRAGVRACVPRHVKLT